MGCQSPAKILRAVKRMTKFLERKANSFLSSKPVLTSVVLPSVNILPVLPTLSIVHVQSTTILSQTQPKPSTISNHDDSHQHMAVNQDQEGALQSPGTDDILTSNKFFEIMNKIQEDLLKPP
jgi:hypothetical protein